jgi:hypothetical protein
MTRIAPLQQIDLTAPSESLTYVEILTPGGIVRVNTNLVSVGTGQPSVVIEVEPDAEHWNTSVNLGRADITLTRRAPA